MATMIIAQFSTPRGTLGEVAKVQRGVWSCPCGVAGGAKG